MAFSSAPDRFNGTFEELYHTHISKNLIKPEAMHSYHKLYMQYIGTKRPVYVVRTLGTVKRFDIRNKTPEYRKEYDSKHTTVGGGIIHFSDNAPSWCSHAVAYHKSYDLAQFEELIRNQMPCQMSQVPKYEDVGQHANRQGWLFAPIFTLKEENTNWQNWTTKDLTKAFFKNTHPCNYFLFPKNHANATKVIAKTEIINFMKYEYQRLYGDTWREFCEFVREDANVKRPGARIVL